MLNIQTFAAFTRDGAGGNPAGIVFCDHFPSPEAMQKVAADIGFSETVFAVPTKDAYRVRYFSPEAEVPFCGHATIALGAAIASDRGEVATHLITSEGEVSLT